jgi:Spy/CpxP family protein refolding chaperone
MSKWLIPLAMLSALCAQPPDRPVGDRGSTDRKERPGMDRRPWWDGPIAQDLKLTDVQLKQIRQAVKDFRPRTFELWTTVNKAETEFQAAINEDPVDQKKANDAIERLVTARGDLFRVNSQLDLKFRSVLTAQQWQDLQKAERQRHGGPYGPPGGRGKRGPGGPGGAPTPPVNQQK